MDVVVIDVLRATTVMATALASGAASVVTFCEVADALAYRDHCGQSCRLGGERGGLRIEGFDLGNSPREYTVESLMEQTLVQTTTNGTRAIQGCIAARRLFTGAFINLRAVTGCLLDSERVLIVCAGTNGHISREDVLCAGALCRRLLEQSPMTLVGDQAAIALSTWDDAVGLEARQETIYEALLNSRGGRNLVQLGLAVDIRDASQIDSCSHVPICTRSTPPTFSATTDPLSDADH